jgi:hypothetical protein
MKQRRSSILLFILVFVLCAFAQKASAQCKYVSMDKGKATFTSIPCDFPVQLSTGNPAADKENFLNAVADWQKLHPDFVQVNIVPGVASGNFIQIPNQELVNISAEKVAAMRENSGFYQITH